MAEDLIELGNTDHEADRSIFMIGIYYNPWVHRRLHAMDEFAAIFDGHFPEALVCSPRTVVYRHKVVCYLVHGHALRIPHFNTIPLNGNGGFSEQAFRSTMIQQAVINQLIVKRLESVVSEERLVVGRIVVEAIGGRILEIVGEQAPKLVLLAKIHRSVHALHALLYQPVFGCVEEQVGGLLIVDALEKSNAANGIIQWVAHLLIYEGCNSADGLICPVEQQITNYFAMLKGLVSGRIEHFLYILCEGGYPMWGMRILAVGELHPPADVLAVSNLNCSHDRWLCGTKVHVWLRTGCAGSKCFILRRPIFIHISQFCGKMFD